MPPPEWETHFQGTLLVLVPHMDDEALACGGLIALLPEKRRIHLAYATDGRGSPAPLLPWRDHVDRDLKEARLAEARNALAVLGVPAENLCFFSLPDGRLQRSQTELRRRLEEQLDRLRPDHLLIPFRYDRHPDHLALNHAAMAAARTGRFAGPITEYFVYHHWRLLPEKDIRRYIRPADLLTVDMAAAAERKRAALACYTSQTTRFFPWQTRPNLTPALLDEVSRAPEQFLPFRPERAGSRVFTRLVPWIRLAHRLEPALKKGKDQAAALLRRGVGR